jgi:hypothetical protein
VALVSDDFGQDVGEARGLHHTGKALLVFFNGAKHWIPASQLHDDSEVQDKGDTGVLVVTDRWARKMRWGKYRDLGDE